MKEIKVLIVEMDSSLGPMVKARLRLLGLNPKNIILASSRSEATEKTESARKNGINVAIVGHITHYGGLIDEQEIIDTLKTNVPGIAIITCTGRTMMGANVDIPRPIGYLEIEEVVQGLFKKKRKSGMDDIFEAAAKEVAQKSRPGFGSEM